MTTITTKKHRHANLAIPATDEAAHTGPASQETMWGLWYGVLRHCLSLFEPAQDEKPTAAHLNVARRFLKDNAVRVDESHKRGTVTGLQALAALDLPFTSKH